MKTIKVGEKEYTLEYTFEAAEHKNLVQSMFNVVSGAYVIRNGAKNEAMAAAMFDGVAEMVADIPSICRTAFYAGLLERNAVDEESAKSLMRQYMKENELSYSGLYSELKAEMENDGFFGLSGISDMIQEMNETATKNAQAVKAPQDRKRKQTSAK